MLPFVRTLKQSRKGGLRSVRVGRPFHTRSLARGPAECTPTRSYGRPAETGGQYSPFASRRHQVPSFRRVAASVK